MYTVLWRPDAAEELTRIWIGSDSATRQSITSAAFQIDEALAKDPTNIGESREGTGRVCFVFPLGILFDVNAPNKLVRVLRVWQYGKRK
jgi:hypothetical protein